MMRTVLWSLGVFSALVIGVVLGALIGVMATSGSESAAAPRTVTVERTVEVTQPDSGSDSTSASASSSASASASAAAGPAEADIECQVGQECDLDTGTVTVDRAEKTSTLTSEFMQPKEGNYVVVNFQYTYNGNQPITTGEIPWVLTDGDGRNYQFDSDATIEYSNVEESILYEDVNPGVARPGKVIFQVAPDAEDFTLTISDLATPQAGRTANVEFG